MVQRPGNTKGRKICVHGRSHLKYAHDTPTNYLELLICFLIVKLFNILLYFSRMNYLPFQIGIVTFFLSAILDNLTSTIVMVSLLRKLVPPSEYRKYDFSTPVISAHSNFLLTIMSLFWLMMTISLHHYTYVRFMVALSGNVLNSRL